MAGDDSCKSVAIRIQQHLVIPDFLQSVSLKYVKLGYHYALKHFMYLALLPLLVAAAAEIGRVGRREHIWLLWESLHLNLINVLFCSAAFVFLATVYFMARPRRVYLLDFACYKPDDRYKCSMEVLEDFAAKSGKFNDASLEFQKKVVWRSGLGPETYVPAFVFDEPGTEPSMRQARREAEQVMFGAIDEVLDKTHVKPKDIGMLIVNCSLFNPTPSLSAMIVNHYKLRGNIKSFNLAGMGCSAGLISVDLAKDLLRVHPNSCALIVSTENITQNWYVGNDRSMLVTNCLFRIGGAAILLTNRTRDRHRAKYELVHSVRTHKGADDKSFGCVEQREDELGLRGVSLSKNLMAVAGEALKTNISTLGPLVLPISEQAIFVAHLVARRILHMKHVKPYIPDFKLAFEHFCIHAGGRGVLDEIQKNLQLGSWHMEPARMTLHRFGNTSSSSLWYELAYSEAKERIRRGDRVWQIAFGSGFKCNSVVWRATRNLDKPYRNPWLDCLHRYPVDMSAHASPSPS
ncbi:hypothetical protein SELMODRAFT_91671 [Selaginella moellendorffii]|uniref:3-ketoacyl-CoA synthase n=1 Tax=Selaginella moellendorffii TaxID=88036 RepID=D8REC4_SELML|nr:3-ketoacyl-CoA synthase 11 [Selaginella moellendorffii]EFJ29634.1 hypothetical protein SELMODRAFT_91671 [Selaginella moellendorffii]|eukprot:XP_002969546.1 3-ketoacyl-CoA synthase 11 [Selaginella moellendorffii]